MNTEISRKLAKRIRELREKKGLTQEKLSELSDIDYKHIQLLESKNPPAAKLDTIDKLAKAFNMSLSRFLNFK